MLRLRRFVLLLIGSLCGWGLALPLSAQVTGLTPILAPSANFAVGSQNDLVMEFQASGNSNSDAISVFNFLNSLVSPPAAQGGTGLPQDIANFKLWFQSSSSIFSPALSTPVTVTAIGPLNWATLSNNLPVTAGGYLFLTADINTGAQLGDIFELLMPSASVSFTSGFVYPTGTASVTNTSPQTIVADGTALSVASVNVPTGSLSRGSTNDLVFQMSVSTTGTALFETIQVANQLSALYSTDISNVKLWYRAGGGTFSVSGSTYLGTLPSTGSKTWGNSTPINWNVNNGDALYITVDILSGATLGNACQFGVPANGVVFSSGSLPAAAVTNTGIQTIPLPTPTPTRTPTVTFTPTSTYTPTSTNTFTFTYTATSANSFTPVPTNTPTSTPTTTFTSTPTNTFTLTNTPPPTNTPTMTPTVTSTITLTYTPTGSATSSPTPNAALYLDQNYFNPNLNGLGMDVRVDQTGEVKLDVFNMAGELVRRIADLTESPGNYRFAWDGRNSAGDLVGNGIYLIVIHTPTGNKIQKVIVLK